MKSVIVKLFMFLVVMSSLVGCIHNDLPYPVIFGNVDSIEFQGQKELTIDSKNRVVSVVLSDTVDIRSIKIEKLVITPDASATIKSGEILDFSTGTGYQIGEPFKFTISTFQNYEWEIVVSQPIERDVVISGMIGKAEFDVKNLSVLVKVSQSQDLYDIKVSKFVVAPSVATYSPDPYTISNFSKIVQIGVSYFGITELWNVHVQHTMQNAVTNTPNVWSRFAYLSGSVNTALSYPTGFEYKQISESEWQSIAVDHKDGVVESVVKGLKPNTTYVYRTFVGGDYGSEVEFTTDTEPAIPNLDFDEAYQEGKAWYFNQSGGNSYWATGNEGVITAGKDASTTSVTGDEAVTGKAVRMVTYNDVMMVKVAAGNLFTGTYKTKMSADPSEALKSATFGRPYNGRPTALKGWYRYSPQTITESSYWPKAATQFDMNFADSVGKSDWCQIYVVLEKWPTGAEVRPDNEDLITRIAYGELRNNQEVANYTAFTIPLTYYSLTEKPNHVTIVSSSSINGGYFCGAAGSILYVDDFSLSFDYQGD